MAVRPRTAVEERALTNGGATMVSPRKRRDDDVPGGLHPSRSRPRGETATAHRGPASCGDRRTGLHPDRGVPPASPPDRRGPPRSPPLAVSMIARSTRPSCERHRVGFGSTANQNGPRGAAPSESRGFPGCDEPARDTAHREAHPRDRCCPGGAPVRRRAAGRSRELGRARASSCTRRERRRRPVDDPRRSSSAPRRSARRPR